MFYLNNEACVCVAKFIVARHLMTLERAQLLFEQPTLRPCSVSLIYLQGFWQQQNT